MISRSGMLVPLVAVLVWADRKLNIGGRGEVVSPAGPQMDCSRRGHRQPGFRLTGVRRAPYSIRGAAEKADISVIPGPSEARSPESISPVLRCSLWPFPSPHFSRLWIPGWQPSAAPRNDERGAMPGAGTDK